MRGRSTAKKQVLKGKALEFDEATHTSPVLASIAVSASGYRLQAIQLPTMAASVARSDLLMNSTCRCDSRATSKVGGCVRVVYKTEPPIGGLRL